MLHPTQPLRCGGFVYMYMWWKEANNVHYTCMVGFVANLHWVGVVIIKIWINLPQFLGASDGEFKLSIMVVDIRDA
jgi:hypothetical protein